MWVWQVSRAWKAPWQSSSRRQEDAICLDTAARWTHRRLCAPLWESATASPGRLLAEFWLPAESLTLCDALQTRACPRQAPCPRRKECAVVPWNPTGRARTLSCPWTSSSHWLQSLHQDAQMRPSQHRQQRPWCPSAPSPLLGLVVPRTRPGGPREKTSLPAAAAGSAHAAPRLAVLGCGPLPPAAPSSAPARAAAASAAAAFAAAACATAAPTPEGVRLRKNGPAPLWDRAGWPRCPTARDTRRREPRKHCQDLPSTGPPAWPDPTGARRG
mmetsp:Transcript_60908/g.149850  ORF Transcript_60908/g.149850 Transcript_60908/m.149850 type:complete len:272 (+) Transcript_60908:975-1790(+)